MNARSGHLAPRGVWTGSRRRSGGGRLRRRLERKGRRLRRQQQEGRRLQLEHRNAEAGDQAVRLDGDRLHRDRRQAPDGGEGRRRHVLRRTEMNWRVAGGLPHDRRGDRVGSGRTRRQARSPPGDPDGGTTPTTSFVHRSAPSRTTDRGAMAGVPFEIDPPPDLRRGRRRRPRRPGGGSRGRCAAGVLARSMVGDDADRGRPAQRIALQPDRPRGSGTGSTRRARPVAVRL